MKKLFAIMLVFIMALALACCSKTEVEDDTQTGPDETESYEYTSEIYNETTTQQEESYSTEVSTVIKTTLETSTSAVATTAVQQTQTIPAATTTTTTAVVTTAAPTTNAPASKTATKAEIIKTLSDAVNKTKAYKGNITVNHEESFDLDEPVVTLDNASGISSLATQAVNFVKGLVLKPSSEVYSFSNGTATTSEKEQTQLLLPKDKAFSLPENGVAKAEMSESNGKKHIKITLVAEETNSLSEAPLYNSNSIGYLNLDGKFSIIQIDALEIDYPGSTIDAVIKSDGYVESVTYVINLKAYAKAHGMGISGSATFNGSQTEIWNINW